MNWVRLFLCKASSGHAEETVSFMPVGRRFIRRRKGLPLADAAGDEPPPYDFLKDGAR